MVGAPGDVGAAPVPVADPLGALFDAGEALVALAREGDLDVARVSAVVREAAGLLGCGEPTARRALCRVVARDRTLLSIDPSRALDIHLRLLVAVAHLSSASLWMALYDGRCRCVARTGNGKPTRRTRSVARAILRGDATEQQSAGGTISGTVVRRWGMPVAALVVRLPLGDRDAAAAATEDVAATLGPVLERAALLEESTERDRALSETANRRLTRLTLDMHDGPLQDVVALLSDVRLYRRQLARTLAGVEHADILLGRIDDFEARLIAVDDDLRELAQSFESPSLLERPFAEVIEGELQLTRSRAGVDGALDLRVDPESLTPSQRFAILRIVQESLANVRDHSAASRVEVSVLQEEGRVTMEVTDDGIGFAVDKTLVRAGRRGRLGLVGMAERVRLLGGTFDVRSEPGNGTTISASLPEWRVPGASRPA